MGFNARCPSCHWTTSVRAVTLTTGRSFFIHYWAPNRRSMAPFYEFSYASSQKTNLYTKMWQGTSLISYKYAHTHTCLTALFPGLPGWAGTRKVKPIWILLKQETVSDSGISWAICMSAPHSRQITTPAPHHSVFTGQMPFLPPNQQLQSTEGTSVQYNTKY